MLEQHRRPARFQNTVTQFGHLELRVDASGDAAKLAGGFELRDEFAQVAIGHGGLLHRARREECPTRGRS
jgi:hypothetical protein